MNSKPFIIPLFIPHVGCAHRCVFCNQVRITGLKEQRVSPRQARERIAEFLGFKGNHRGAVEVAFYGGNFLGLPNSYRASLLSEAQKFVEKGLVKSIRCSTRPDSVSNNTLNTLAPYKVRVVEIGAQSMDDTVLALSRRGHTADHTREAVKVLKSHGLRVGLQIMPGLPGDTTQSIVETGQGVAKLKPDFVRIYPTVVVKNTALEKWYNSGRFKPLSLPEAVEITKRLFLFFQAQGISIIRMGLQATGSLLEPGNVVGGPFHPAFGHLVHSAIFFDLAVRKLESQQGLSKRVALKVYPSDIPRLMGQKKGNIKGLLKRFNLEELRVFPDPGIPRNTVGVTNLPT